MRDEIEQSQNDSARALATVTVFKTQMKIFEKKFLADRQYESRIIETSEIID